MSDPSLSKVAKENQNSLFTPVRSICETVDKYFRDVAFADNKTDREILSLALTGKENPTEKDSVAYQISTAIDSTKVQLSSDIQAVSSNLNDINYTVNGGFNALVDSIRFFTPATSPGTSPTTPIADSSAVSGILKVDVVPRLDIIIHLLRGIRTTGLIGINNTKTQQKKDHDAQQRARVEDRDQAKQPDSLKGIKDTLGGIRTALFKFEFIGNILKFIKTILKIGALFWLSDPRNFKAIVAIVDFIRDMIPKAVNVLNGIYEAVSEFLRDNIPKLIHWARGGISWLEKEGPKFFDNIGKIVNATVSFVVAVENTFGVIKKIGDSLRVVGDLLIASFEFVGGIIVAAGTVLGNSIWGIITIIQSVGKVFQGDFEGAGDLLVTNFKAISENFITGFRDAFNLILSAFIKASGPLRMIVGWVTGINTNIPTDTNTSTDTNTQAKVKAGQADAGSIVRQPGIVRVASGEIIINPNTGGVTNPTPTLGSSQPAQIDRLTNQTVASRVTDVQDLSQAGKLEQRQKTSFEDAMKLPFQTVVGGLVGVTEGVMKAMGPAASNVAPFISRQINSMGRAFGLPSSVKLSYTPQPWTGASPSSGTLLNGVSGLSGGSGGNSGQSGGGGSSIKENYYAKLLTEGGGGTSSGSGSGNENPSSIIVSGSSKDSIVNMFLDDYIFRSVKQFENSGKTDVEMLKAFDDTAGTPTIGVGSIWVPIDWNSDWFNDTEKYRYGGNGWRRVTLADEIPGKDETEKKQNMLRLFAASVAGNYRNMQTKISIDKFNSLTRNQKAIVTSMIIKGPNLPDVQTAISKINSGDIQNAVSHMSQRGYGGLKGHKTRVDFYKKAWNDNSVDTTTFKYASGGLINGPNIQTISSGITASGLPFEIFQAPIGGANFFSGFAGGGRVHGTEIAIGTPWGTHISPINTGQQNTPMGMMNAAIGGALLGGFSQGGMIGPPQPSYLPNRTDSRTITPNLVKMLHEFEGYREVIPGGKVKAYPDPKSGGLPWTIGHGLTFRLDKNGKRINFNRDSVLTDKEANFIFRDVLRNVYIPEMQNIPYLDEMHSLMRDALYSFGYNLGSKFYNSGKDFATITRTLKAKEWTKIPKVLELYHNPGTSVAMGLLKRRKAEGEVWKRGLAALGDKVKYFSAGGLARLYPYMLMRPTPVKRGGLIEFDLMKVDDKGNINDMVPVVSGQPDKQILDFNSDKENSGRPLPIGEYSIGTHHRIGKNHPKYSAIGNLFIDLNPKTKMPGNPPRHSFGIHEDYDRETFPGTMGCIGTNTRAGLDKIVGWLSTDKKLNTLVATYNDNVLADGNINGSENCSYGKHYKKGETYQGMTITSPYGMRWGRLHGGIDIAGPKGTLINFGIPGKVAFSGLQGTSFHSTGERRGTGYGYMVDLVTGNNDQFRFAHLSEPSLLKNDQDFSGGLIGKMGSTGSSTGSHLHFEYGPGKGKSGAYGGVADVHKMVDYLGFNASPTKTCGSGSFSSGSGSSDSSSGSSDSGEKTASPMETLQRGIKAMACSLALATGQELSDECKELLKSNSSTSSPTTSSPTPIFPGATAGQTPTGIPLTQLRTKEGKTAPIASKLYPNFQGFINELQSTGYKIDQDFGGYSNRGGGSYHDLAAAIDINSIRNPHCKLNPPDPKYVEQCKGKADLVTDLPSNVAQMAAKYGLGWGGNWRSSKDAMHFSAGKREQGSVKIDDKYLSVADEAESIKLLREGKVVTPNNFASGGFVSRLKKFNSGGYTNFSVPPKNYSTSMGKNGSQVVVVPVPTGKSAPPPIVPTGARQHTPMIPPSPPYNYSTAQNLNSLGILNV